MPYCDNCGAHVSQSFYRVFSNPQGELWGCISCGAIAAGERRAFEDKPNTSAWRQTDGT